MHINFLNFFPLFESNKAVYNFHVLQLDFSVLGYRPNRECHLTASMVAGRESKLCGKWAFYRWTTDTPIKTCP